MEKTPDHPWFPLFISLESKRIIVFGGGKIAARRIVTLRQFGGEITVISPRLVQELREETLSGKMTVIDRKYREGDCEGSDLVLAATNDLEINHRIAEECQQLGDTCQCGGL